MPTVEVLRDFLNEIVLDPKLFPIYTSKEVLIKTCCNLSVRKTARLFDCREFDRIYLLADDMLDIMQKNLNRCWNRVNGPEAAHHALSGGLAIAASSSGTLEEAHGHICVIYPKDMEMSGSLGKRVPFIVNIGKGDPTAEFSTNKDGTKTKRNWVCKVSQGFPVHLGEPSYFTWIPPALPVD